MRTTAVITSLLVVLMASCHSTKQAARTERVETNTSVLTRQDYADHDWQQSWRTLTLELDSFELWLPTARVDVPSDTTDSTAAAPASLSSPTARGGVLLKAKRASLATNTTVAHTSTKNEQRVDSIHHHGSTATDERQASDRVAVTKPPDMPWTAMGIIAAVGVAVGCCIYFYRKH